MSGQQPIYVDFSARSLDGRFYKALLSDFDATPKIGDRFIGTDYDEFEDIECQVLAIDYDRQVVFHRPVDPASVPGTAPLPASKPQRGRDRTDMQFDLHINARELPLAALMTTK